MSGCVSTTCAPSRVSVSLACWVGFYHSTASKRNSQEQTRIRDRAKHAAYLIRVDVLQGCAQLHKQWIVEVKHEVDEALVKPGKGVHSKGQSMCSGKPRCMQLNACTPPCEHYYL